MIIRLILYVLVPLILGLRNTRNKPIAKSTTFLVVVICAILVSVDYDTLLLIVNGTQNPNSYFIGVLLGQIAGGTLTGTIIGIIVLSLFKRNEDTPESEEIQPQNSTDSIDSKNATRAADVTDVTDVTGVTDATDAAVVTDATVVTNTVFKRSAFEIPEEELRALKKLRDVGVLTEEEFVEKKKKLLGI